MAPNRYLLPWIAVVCACGPNDASLGSKRPLLTLTGLTLDTRPTASAPDAGTDSGELLPSIAFFAEERLIVVEPELEGGIPGDFELRLLSPPPDDALMQMPEGLPDEPRIAFAYVVAAHAGHAETFQQGRELPPENDLACEGCAGQCTRARWCTQDEERCYERQVCCTPDDCCELRTVGDASLRNPWMHFAGLVQHYVILYLADPAAADTRAAHAFGAQRALAAGYHLLSVRALTTAEQTEQSSCLERAHQLGLERYNAAHGTSYSADELHQVLCGSAECAPEVLMELRALFDVACLELGCLSRGLSWVWTPIPDPPSERLLLRLDFEAVPLGFPPASFDSDSSPCE